MKAGWKPILVLCFVWFVSDVNTLLFKVCLTYLCLALIWGWLLYVSHFLITLAGKVLLFDITHLVY